MADTVGEKPLVQEQPQVKTDAEIRVLMIADGFDESEVTDEAIKQRREVDGKLTSTARNTGETVTQWLLRLNAERERLDTNGVKGLATTATAVATEAVTTTAKAAKTAVIDAVESAVEGAPGKAAEYLTEVTDSKIKGFFSGIPGAAGLFDKISSGGFFNSLFANVSGLGGLGALITGFIKKLFGISSANATTKPATDSANIAANPAVVSPVDGAAVVPAAANVDSEVTVIPTVETLAPEIDRKYAYYKSGATLIIRLRGTSENHNAGSNDILKGLADIKFSDIAGMSEEQKISLLGDEVSEKESELRDEILESILSSETETLLRIGLSENSLSNIISPRGGGKLNSNLFKYFGTTEEEGEARLREIMASGFDWKTLTFSEIGMLYISSIPALRIPAGEGISSTFDDIRGFFTDGESLGTEGIEPALYIIPRNILKGFLNGMQGDIVKSTYLNSSNQDIISIVFGEGATVSDADMDIMNQIFNMKNYLMGGFVDNKKLKLSDEQKVIFKNNLDYSSVLSIYAILGGISNVNSINTVSLPILLFAVSKVIGSGNGNESYQGSLYVGNYVREVLLNGSEDGLTEDELTVIKMYGRSVLDLAVLSHLEGFYKTIGLGSGATGLSITELGAGTFAGGFVLKQLGDMQIRKGLAKGKLPLLGSFLRKIGWVGMIGGALTGGAGLLLNNSVSGAFGRDVETALKNNDLDEVRRVLKQHTDSLNSYTTTAGEKYQISSYPGEVPYMIYKGDVYMLNVGGRELSDSGAEIISGGKTWGEKYTQALELLARNTGFGEFSGVVDSVDYTKQTVDGEFVVLGEGEHTAKIRLTDLVNILDLGTPVTVGESFLNTESMTFGSEGQEGFPLQVLSENYILYFQKVGPVGTVFSTQTT